MRQGKPVGRLEKSGRLRARDSTRDTKENRAAMALRKQRRKEKREAEEEDDEEEKTRWKKATPESTHIPEGDV